MRSAKETTQSFLVRIWVEPRETKDAEPKWRGVIEHVPSGNRVYFDRLEQVAIHLATYLDAMGVKVDEP